MTNATHILKNIITENGVIDYPKNNFKLTVDFLLHKTYKECSPNIMDTFI